MFLLRRFLIKYKLMLVIGPLCKLTEAVLELFAPLVMAAIIDNGVAKNDFDYVLKMGGVMVLLGAAGLAFALVCQYMASYTSQGAGTEIRTALFHHIGKLSHKELDEIGTPSLITRMTGDINAVQANIAMTMRLLLRAPFLIIGALVMALFINPAISLIFFGASAVIGAILYLVMTRSMPFYRKIQSLVDRVSLLSRENLSGNRVIRAFSKQKAQQESINEETQRLAKLSVRVGRLSALLNPATYAAAYIAIALILCLGGIKVNEGNLLSGDIIALTSYMTQILLAMIVLANLVVLLSRGSASARRIRDILDTESSVKEINTEKLIRNINAPIIEFRNVTFSYGDGDNELEDISFNIERNTFTGIIGTTGSGKSTLLSLILRYYDVSDGMIMVDGNDVRGYSFSDLRGNIGVVPQRSVLFSGTIRSNMLWQNENADDEEIINALKLAQAYDFVSELPNGLDSYVAQGGANFSGGQRQRLCIARALIGNPGLIILDDSFSALDFATEKALRTGLRSLKNTTLIIVTQRCSTIMDADKILVLEDGKIEGEGVHNELFDTCPAYREICLSQLKNVEAER